MTKAFGLDIGYQTVKLYLPEAGVPYIAEPAVLALNANDSIAACGEDALRLSRRIPGAVRLIRPFSGTTTPAAAHAEAFLSYLIRTRKLKGADLTLSFSGTRDDTTERLFVEAAQQAGVRDVSASDAIYAAASGCGVSSAADSAVVNIGASVTDMGCFSRGERIDAVTIPQAGNSFSRAVISYVIQKYRLSVDLNEADRIKATVGTLSPVGKRTVEALTLRPAMGLPKKAVLSEEEISAALEDVFDELADQILALIRRQRVEPDKIILTGGGARLSGLAPALAPLLCLPVIVAEEPELAVIRGLAGFIRNTK